MQVIKPMMPIILDFTGRPLQPIGDGLAVSGEHRTGGGEFHTMRGALHQSRTALCLQLFDLLADGRLRPTRGLGRGGERTILFDLPQRDQ